MSDVIVWAELPVLDMTRARAFYSALLGTPVDEMPGQGGKVALLMPPGTGDPDDVSADLALDAITKPSATHGPVIYLSANGDIDGMIERAIMAGGTLRAPKQNFGEMGGWLAWIVDSEGNLIGLQQPV
jgi:hypothetical protein